VEANCQRSGFVKCMHMSDGLAKLSVPTGAGELGFYAGVFT